MTDPAPRYLDTSQAARYLGISPKTLMRMRVPELGDIGLLELFEFRGRFGLGIERDLHFRPKHRISTYAEAASAAGRIVEFGPELDAAARIRTEAEAPA